MQIQSSKIYDTKQTPTEKKNKSKQGLQKKEWKKEHNQESSVQFCSVCARIVKTQTAKQNMPKKTPKTNNKTTTKKNSNKLSTTIQRKQ